MDQLHIYNTLTRNKEPFEPLHKDMVGMYVCGPTVYGDPHLGHAKSYVSFDLVVRYLRYCGYRVRYVQNITDVGHLTDDADEGEDKLVKQSRLERLEPMEIAEKYIRHYFRDMDRLNIERPNIAPRATGHIPEQIEMIEKLIDNGHAYQSGGNVYFDVTSHQEYGKLSGRNLEEAETGVRVETVGDKRHPADFALWKEADESHLMKWRSPWGTGYPGWHIECSAMATKYLGETIDIHGGGLENQFPHHECEIAQCEGAFNKPFVRYWMHNNMVTLNGQKMGKSLGNAISLPQFFAGDHELLTRSWDPEIIRFFLLQSHYRSPTDFSESALEAAESGLRNLYDILELIQGCEPGDAPSFDIQGFRNELESRLNDDFNSARAIAYLFEVLRPLQKQLHQGQVPENIGELAGFLYRFCNGVLGLWPPEERDEADGQLANELIELLLELRANARKARDFETADHIRDRLQEIGVAVEDTPEGTAYRIGQKSIKQPDKEQ